MNGGLARVGVVQGPGHQGVVEKAETGREPRLVGLSDLPGELRDLLLVTPLGLGLG